MHLRVYAQYSPQRGYYVCTLSALLYRCLSLCSDIRPDVCPVPTSARQPRWPQASSLAVGQPSWPYSPARCPCGWVHLLTKKWNSSQNGQVDYTDAAVWASKDRGQFLAVSFLFRLTPFQRLYSFVYKCNDNDDDDDDDCCCCCCCCS